MDVFTVTVIAVQAVNWLWLGLCMYKIARVHERVHNLEARLTMATAPRVAYPVPLEDPRYP